MNEERPVGVFWGRFNPPHVGHLRLIQRFRKRCRLTVVIGSAERRNERANPFGGDERRSMMEGYLRELGIRDVRVVALPDGPSVSWALENMLRRCRPALVFLSTERSRLAKLAERKVRVVRFRRTGRVSSTRLRASIAAGKGDWVRWTGASVVRWILTHDGVARIRRARSRSGASSAPRRSARRRRARAA